MKKILLILAMVLFAVQAWGADRNIYISSTTDPAEDGSIDHPYDSFSDIPWSGVAGELNDIADWVAADDDVYINLSGTFSPAYLNVAVDGSEAHPITIQGPAVLDGNSAIDKPLRIAASHVVIKNLTVTGGTGSGVGVPSAEVDITIDGVMSYDNGLAGILILGAKEIKNCIVYNNATNGIKATGCTGTVNIHDNYVYDNGTTGQNHDGIYAGDSSGATFNIYNNRVFRQLGQSGIDSSSIAGYDPSTYYVYNNWVDSAASYSIASGDADVADIYYVMRNLITGILDKGFVVRDLGTYSYYNNTTIGAASNSTYGLDATSATVRTINIKNNLFYGSQYGIAINDTNLTLTSENNCFYGQLSRPCKIGSTGYTLAEWVTEGYGTDSMEANPCITSTDKLYNNSPCKDAGVVVPGINDGGETDRWGNAADTNFCPNTASLLGIGWSDTGDYEWTCDGSQSAVSGIKFTSIMSAFKTYSISYTISSYSAGSVKICLGGVAACDDSISADGTYTYNYTPTSDLSVYLIADADFEGVVTINSIVEAPNIGAYFGEGMTRRPVVLKFGTPLGRKGMFLYGGLYGD